MYGSDLQFPQSLFKILGNCFNRSNFDWYLNQLYMAQVFNSQVRSRYLSIFSISFIFTLSSRKVKPTM